MEGFSGAQNLQGIEKRPVHACAPMLAARLWCGAAGWRELAPVAEVTCLNCRRLIGGGAADVASKRAQRRRGCEGKASRKPSRWRRTSNARGTVRARRTTPCASKETPLKAVGLLSAESPGRVTR